MGETNKRRLAREAEGWFERYLVGDGIDIGCGDDPVTADCRKWDMLDGDAQMMNGVADESYDWVYSSHCLEHMVEPSQALANWWRILKPGGLLIVMVPDEDLYEQGLWPPHFNTDHKTTWTLHKQRSWSPVSRSLATELGDLPASRILSLRVYDTGYDYSLRQQLTAHLVVSPALGKQIENGLMLTPAALAAHGAELRCLGFWPIDQASNPLGAEVSIEGIVQKCLTN